MGRFDVPYYSWFHGYNTKVLPLPRAPKFALLKQGRPLPMASADEFVNCTKLIAEIKDKEILPQYVSFTGEGLDYELCKHGLETLSINGIKAYKLEHTFSGDVGFDIELLKEFKMPLYRMERPLYALDLDSF